MSTWRTAVTSETITGDFQTFQQAYVDSDGNIVSFTSGNLDDLVTKYFSPSLLEIRYKRSASPLLFLVGDTTSYLWDGSSLTSKSHSSLGTDPIRHALIFKNQYYVIKGTYDGQLWKSSDLLTWTNTGVIYAMNLATDGNVLAVSIAANYIKYSTDGVTFSTQSTWSDNPQQINSVKYLNNRWVAVGNYPEMGDFTFRPWVATTTTDISSGWSTYMNPYLGVGDTAFLDVALVGGMYRYYGAISYYNANLYVWEDGGFSFSNPESYISTNVGYYSMDRLNNNMVATNDGSILSPMQATQYALDETDYENTNPVYCPGTDRNSNSYFVVYDGADYLLKNSSFTTIATIPTAVYGVGGSK